MIEIGEYRIYQADILNWNIEQSFISKKGVSEGETLWKGIGFYHDLGQACVRLLDILVKDTYEDTENVQDVIDTIAEAKEAILEAVKEMGNGNN